MQSDIDEKLSPDQKGKTRVTTLHKLARSIVEMNHGTTKWRFKPHFGIIGPSWKEIVWQDVLQFFPAMDGNAYPWKKFEEQLHCKAFHQSEEWTKLKETYLQLCRFYNAAGFADLILRATKALTENPECNESDHFIIDEYQDFNLAEDALITQLTKNPKGLLIVGDDEQVLYESLKSGTPALIRGLYNDTDFANGMLPFCGRSSFHITKAADHFIQQQREAECIDKIYLPLKNDDDEPKVQMIACATPATAVDYIEKFVTENRAEIDERKRLLEEGKKGDAFLLILTPAKEVKFYGPAKQKIKNIAAEYQAEVRAFSEEYYRLLNSYSFANTPRNNFTFRKLVYYEGVAFGRVHELLLAAMHGEKDFCDSNEQEAAGAMSKCNEIKAILVSDSPIAAKLDQISNLIPITDRANLQREIERKSINQEAVPQMEHEEEEEAELEEIEVKRMGAVELMTIVGSKGLSADHVIIIGFDNVNMNWITKNAFYVALTRARKSLHILTAMKSRGRQAHAFLDQLPDDHLEFFKYKKSDRSKSPLRGKRGFKSYLDWLKGQMVAGLI